MSTIMILPITKSRFKLLRLIYSTQGIKVSRMLRQLGVSQKIGYEHLDELIKTGVVAESRIGSVRILKPELSSEAGQLIYSLIEKENYYRFLRLYPELKKGILMIRSNWQKLGIKSLIFFGSFINNNEEDAKINVLVLSDNSNKERIVNFLKTAFGDVKNAIIARIMNKDMFQKFKDTKQEVYDKMFREHIVVFNPSLFINLIS